MQAHIPSRLDHTQGSHGFSRVSASRNQVQCLLSRSCAEIFRATIPFTLKNLMPDARGCRLSLGSYRFNQDFHGHFWIWPKLIGPLGNELIIPIAEIGAKGQALGGGDVSFDRARLEIVVAIFRFFISVIHTSSFPEFAGHPLPAQFDAAKDLQ